jgi:hypothetical protein
LATAGGPAGPEPPPPCDAPRPGAVAALSRPPLTMPAPLSVSSPAAHETAPTASATTPRRAKQRDLRELGNSGCPRMTLVGWNPVTRTGGPKNHPTAPPRGEPVAEPGRDTRSTKADHSGFGLARHSGFPRNGYVRFERGAPGSAGHRLLDRTPGAGGHRTRWGGRARGGLAVADLHPGRSRHRRPRRSRDSQLRRSPPRSARRRRRGLLRRADAGLTAAWPPVRAARRACHLDAECGALRQSARRQSAASPTSPTASERSRAARTHRPRAIPRLCVGLTYRRGGSGGVP